MRQNYWNDPHFLSLFKEIEPVRGWLGRGEAYLLYNAAKNCTGKGIIVEIGSWHGKSTIFIAKGSKAGKTIPIYAIDPHTGSPENIKKYGSVWTFDIFKKNLQKFNVADLVTPFVKTSRAVVKEWSGKPVEFLWIDGAHEFQFVNFDYHAWNPYLIDGGTIAFHDTVIVPGPRKVVHDQLFLGTQFKKIRFIGGITYATKSSQVTIMDRIQNRIFLILKGFYRIAITLSGKGVKIEIFRPYLSLVLRKH